MSEATLRFNLCDDSDALQIDFEPFINAFRDLFFRTPSSAFSLHANPAQVIKS